MSTKLTVGDIAKMMRDVEKITSKLDALELAHRKARDDYRVMLWRGAWYPLPVLHLYGRVALIKVKKHLLNKQIKAIKHRWSNHVK